MAKQQRKKTIVSQRKRQRRQSQKVSKSHLRTKKTVTLRVRKKSAVIYRHSLQQHLLQQWLFFWAQTQQFLTWLQRYSQRKLQRLIQSSQIWQKYLVAQFAAQTSKGQTKIERKRPVGRPPKVISQKRASRLRPQLIFMFFSLVMTSAICVVAYGLYDYVFKDLPSVDQLITRKENLTTKILDRSGKLLYRIYKDENRTLIPLSRVPPDLIHATIAIEDKDFYTHGGLSLRGIIRALRNDLANDKIQGGSTITQQLVKNTLLSPERTLQRKMREAVLAILVENAFTKDEILEMYFNDVPYGGSTYGIEEAAQRYFGKPAYQLNLAESSFLAGLPAAPSVYAPFGPNPELAYSRQKEVLNRMVEDKYITAEQAINTAGEKLNFRTNTVAIQAPHFVMYVKNLLEKEYGEDIVNQGGLEVRTTLDLDTQNQAQTIVSDELKNLARLRISNGAALVTNPKTGEVLAMVGSKNYFDFASDGQVNVTMRPRQPGSSIKPITYAIAMEKGKSPSSPIVDAPITFNIAGSQPYSPKNYDGKYHGTVTLRTALGSSYNVPAVKTLAEIGIPTMIDKAQEMGISTWQDRRRFGLSLTLGSGEILMTDMATVYGTFANYGETIPLNPILEVKNFKGQTLYRNDCALDEQHCPGTRTLDAKVAYQITDILADNTARTPAFGPRSVLFIPNQQVAVKTGTTNNLRDNWTLGYTTNRLVAVWVGNNDNQPMSYVASGITGASPIWNKIIRTQLNDDQPHTFAVPNDLVKVKICATTGTLPCRGCPMVTEELFVPGTQPIQTCNPAQFLPSPSPSVVPTNNARPTFPRRQYPNTFDRILEGTTSR